MSPDVLKVNGLRRCLVSTRFLELLLTGGVGAADPVNVPKDLRIVAVRFRSVEALLELLVASTEFDGGYQDSWGCPVWQPEFRRAGVGRG